MFAISFCIYLAHALYTLHGVYGDGNGYYAYSNSLYFQKNLDFSLIYDHLTNFQGRNYIFSRIFWPTDTNPYLIGTALSWLPSFLLIDVIGKIFNLGFTRFDLVYEIGTGISGIIFMITGLAFLEKYLLILNPHKIAQTVIASLFLATNVFYYTALEPSLSHQPGFLIICFLLWWTAVFKRNPTNFIVFGLLTGLLASIRIADTVLLLPFYVKLKPRPADFAAIVFGTLLAFLPQLITQKAVYGNMFRHPYLTGESGTWQFIPSRIFEYLFSPKRGLFLWSPILLIGLAGLIKNKAWAFLSAILILWLITSSWSAYLSAGFGQRFSFSALPYFAIGMAAVFKKIPSKFINPAIAIFSLWNFLLIKNVYLHKNLFIQSNDFSINEFLRYMIKLN